MSADPPPPPGGNGPAAERGRPRFWALLLAAAVCGLVLAALASLSLDEGGGNDIEITGAGATQKLFGGIRQEDAELGSASAPVRIEVFNDLQCESCDDWHRDSIVPLVEELVRSGEATLVFRHFPLGERSTNLASFGAVAAGKQGKEWQYIHLFFLNQDEINEVNEDFLRRVAAAVLQLDLDEWEGDRDEPELEERLTTDVEVAVERRLPADPAVVVDGPSGSRELSGAPPPAEIEAAVEAVR